VVALGALGVTSKLALRSASWQVLLVIVGVGYVLTSAVLFGLGSVQIRWDTNPLWGALSAVLAISALILLYVALGTGEAGKVIPVSAAYPAVTLVLAAIFLSESITFGRAGGVLLVIAGVVVLTTVK
jgi:bacterial/archaeal transporter family protein